MSMHVCAHFTDIYLQVIQTGCKLIYVTFYSPDYHLYLIIPAVHYYGIFSVFVCLWYIPPEVRQTPRGLRDVFVRPRLEMILLHRTSWLITLQWIKHVLNWC